MMTHTCGTDLVDLSQRKRCSNAGVLASLPALMLVAILEAAGDTFRRGWTYEDPCILSY
jgi:hypothetical protein